MFSAAASVSRGGSTDEGSQRGNPSDWSPPVESELPLWYRCTVADDVEIACFLKRRDVVLLDVRDHVELRFGKVSGVGHHFCCDRRLAPPPPPPPPRHPSEPRWKFEHTMHRDELRKPHQGQQEIVFPE